jgi:hypothetical protein
VNGSNSATKAGGVLAETSRVSVCEEQYGNLSSAQSYESDVISQLFSRLSLVLAPEAPTTAGSSLAACSPPSSSEVHGWLQAATNRSANNAERLQALMSRLTV